MRQLFLSLLIAVGVALIAVPAWAAESDSLTDEQVGQIRQNCKQAQSVMQRLQATDVATRVTRGQVYENLLSKLIAPFDARVGANNYDASGLSADANALTQSFSDFKADYLTYANQFSGVLGYNCEANPRGFYDALSATRQSRAKVSADVTAINSGLAKYADAFSTLRQSIGN